MTVTIRAHFDGKVIVPDERVTLPRDTPLTVHVEAPAPDMAAAEQGERRAAYDAFLARARARPVPHLASNALRREAIYED
jgi:predicted nucleic acid-binding protein